MYTITVRPRYRKGAAAFQHLGPFFQDKKIKKKSTTTLV